MPIWPCSALFSQSLPVSQPAHHHSLCTRASDWSCPEPSASTFLASLPSPTSLDFYCRTQDSCEYSQSIPIPHSWHCQTALSCTVELSVAGGCNLANAEAPQMKSALGWVGELFASFPSLLSLCLIFLVSPIPSTRTALNSSFTVKRTLAEGPSSTSWPPK